VQGFTQGKINAGIGGEMESLFGTSEERGSETRLPDLMKGKRGILTMGQGTISREDSKFRSETR